MRIRSLLLALAVALASQALFAATFVVPNDRDMVRRADAITVATVLSQYSRITDDDSIETVTVMSPEETIKGLVTASATTFEVHEPGGVVGDRALIIPGVPRFTPGQRLILFLTRTPQETWAVTDLVLGKFRMAMDRTGEHIAVRDEEAIVGWDPDLTPHVEPRRQADKFLAFLRDEAKGTITKQDYFVPRSPIAGEDLRATTFSDALNAPATTLATFTARSYTFDVSGGPGARWTAFPSAVTFFMGATQEPGAPGGGSTAVQTALGAWTNDCGSNVNYTYGGTDSTHTKGLTGPDGANTVLFERSLSAYGVGPFACSGNSYSGTLGIGGVTSTNGQHTFSGDTFYTTAEGDVEMNQGLANCSLLFSNGDFNSAVTHEIGHTLGFRHSDQSRADNPSVTCSSDPTLECSSRAIMTAFVTAGLNAALQPWDINAVRALYPGGSCTACTPPAITAQPQSQTIAAGTAVTLSVTATGTGPLSYQWYGGSSGFTGAPQPGATGSTFTVSPTVTSQYWVRVTNSCGSADSTTTLITVTNSCTPPSITTQPQSRTVSPGTAVTLSVTASGSALSYQWFNGASGFTGSPINGATGTSVTVSPTVTSQYWVRVSNACGSVNSATALITVTSCSPPSITSQPQSTTTTPGAPVTLSVSASGTGLTYQWFNGSSGYTLSPINGATGTSVTVAPTVTSQYWVRVSNSCGSVNSNTALVTVTSGCTPPSITTQPQSTTSTAGAPVTLSVSATGTNLTYQWFNGASGYTLSPISGATGPSVTVSPTVTSQYWVRVSNSCGSVDSTTALITVNCAPPSITSQPQSVTIQKGQSTTLTVSASGSGLTYQWFNGASGYTLSPINGATGPSVTVSPTVTSQYWVRVSNSCGSVNSNTALVTVQ